RRAVRCSASVAGRGSRPWRRGTCPARRARVPTVRSWTRNELAAAADLRHLLRFRGGTISRRLLFGWAVGFLTLTTAAVATVPGFLPGADDSGRASDFPVLI